MADRDNANAAAASGNRMFIYGDGFQVYNPVDDDFEEWPDPEKNLYTSEELMERRDAVHEQEMFRRKLKDADNFVYNFEKNDKEIKVFDIDDPDFIDRSSAASETVIEPLPLENLDSCDNDDALAQAIAEQDLPPGVSAVEQQEIMMRLLTQQLRRGDWANDETLSPALEQRLRDFQFAQRKRRETYGNERPWGILGLYDHLAGIRLDVEWAEDAAWRRGHKEPYLSWSDFNQKHSKGWNEPRFTYILILVCTGMLIASFAVNGWMMEPITINPMIGPSANTLIKLGAKQTSLIVNQGEWYRLFSPMFLHAGIIHYILNMIALWFIGKAVEQCHGSMAAAILFIIPAVGGTILSALFLPQYISVGASGGIFGLIGACIADICINWSLLFSKHVNDSGDGTRFRHVRVLLWLLFDIVINCLVGLTPFVDNFTHLGGMIYGFLCGLSTIERLSTDFFGIAKSKCERARNVIVRFAGLILSVILIMITTAVLVDSSGTGSPCVKCNYISCVPFPPWANEDNKWWYCDDCARVTADAKLDSRGYYSLAMSCPDGVIKDIDLSDTAVTDRQWIRKQLPDICRKNCDNLFAT
jgi:membrane associated rhomboid family serine protease